MSTYAKIENNQVTEYPLFETDIRRRFLNTSFPENFVPPDEYVLVSQAPVPAYNEETQKIELGPPEFTDGGWIRNWIVRDISQEELDKRKNDLRIRMNVSRFQARAVLYQMNLLDTIETLMANNETNMLTRLAWQDAQEFRRLSPAVIDIGKQLNLTDDELDQLFIQARSIEV